jgi:hypothetical protein
MNNDEKLEHVLKTVEPGRRALLKKMVLSTAFTVPIIASFSVKDLAYAQMGSHQTTTVTGGFVTITVTAPPVTSTTTDFETLTVTDTTTTLDTTTTTETDTTTTTETTTTTTTTVTPLGP